MSLNKEKKTHFSWESLILPVSVLVVWELAVDFKLVPTTLIASPIQVLKDFVEFIATGKIFMHIGASLSRLLIGFIIGSLVGISLGLVIGTSKRFEKLFHPTFLFLAPIPPIAWIPLLIIACGIGEGSKVALIALGAFFITYFHTIHGIRATDQKLVDLATVYRKDNWQLVKKILLPSALPSIFTGLRLALSLSWILLIAAEVIASSQGLGWLIWDARNFSRPDDMIVGIITIGILGKLSDSILVLLEHHMLRWRVAFTGK